MPFLGYAVILREFTTEESCCVFMRFFGLRPQDDVLFLEGLRLRLRMTCTFWRSFADAQDDVFFLGDPSAGASV